jgi:hypothetical protein
MRRFYICLLWVSMLALPVSGQDVAARQFQDIAARLDIGGDLFLVIHAGRWLENVLTRLENGAGGVPPDSADERDLRASSGTVRRFITRQGISGLQGLGVSSIPLQAGLSHLKVFLLRDPQDANLPFWRGLFGWQPRRLLSLDFLPADTGFAAAWTPDLGGMWALLESARSELGTESLDQVMSRMTLATQSLAEMDPLVLLRSLRDEVLLGARHVGNGTPESPYVWEWMVVVGTAEQQLHHAVQHAFRKKGNRFLDVSLAGYTMQRVLLPGDDEEVRDRPAFASVPGFFVMGNTSGIVEDALRAQRHRSGLLARPEFVDAYRGQNMVNNGILFVSAEGSRRLRLLQEQRLWKQIPGEMNPFSRRLLEELAGEGARGAVFALTLANWRQGVMISGRSGIGGQSLGGWLGSFPASWWFRLPDLLERMPVVSGPE